MADELTLTIKAVYAKSGTEITFPDTAKQRISITVAGTKILQHRQSVGFAAEEALELGEVAAGGYIVMVNRDATNFVSFRQGTGTTNVIRLSPGEVAAFRLHASSTAPYVIADTAAVELEYLLLSA